MHIKNITKSISLYKCDWCGVEFKSFSRRKNSKTQGCSRLCGSNASRATVKQNLLEKHGVENVSQLKYVREKVKQTCIKRFGTECSFQAETVKEKIKKTVYEKYGVEYSGQSKEIRAKTKKTWEKRYGTDHPWKCPKIKAKSINTIINRYGVDSPQKSKEIKNKTINTNRKRYGCDNPMQNKQIYSKAKETCLKRYGTQHISQSNIIKQKTKNTSMKRYGTLHPMQSSIIQKKLIKSLFINGKGLVSKGELECLEYLKKIYDVVEHQVCINGWIIDFYIPKQKVYIQFDGVYWHGLNRSLDLIKNPISKHDKDISKKWHRDREQEIWFKENNKILIRIIDKDFNYNKKINNIEKWLMSFINNGDF